MLLLVLITNARAAERQVLRGHIVRVVAELNLQMVGRLTSSTNLDLVIALPLRNQEALTNLLQEQYAPTNPRYHHWLTPDEFAAKFGPTEEDYQAVIEFARVNGFTVTGTHPNRTLVDVRGSVADIERTFRVALLTYQHPTEAREFYAPDTEPSLDLAVPVLHVTGLNNYTLPHPVSIRATSQNTTLNPSASGSGPSGSYIGQDFSAAYLPGVSLTGTGQVVALVEFDGYYANDITKYETQASLPNITLTNVLVDGFSGTPTANGAQVEEVSLDIEMAISMAPGLSELMVYEGPSPDTTETEALDTLNKIATDNLAKQISCSWELEEVFPGNTDFDQIYQQYAMQGQSFFQSSGDNGAFTNSWPSPQQQSDSPYVTLVGGTTLTTTGPKGVWLSETVWNQNLGTGFGATNDASGGGVSTNYTIPTWQQGIDMTFNQGSTNNRNVPDVAMAASGIYVISNNGVTNSVVGTSAAAPLWAGFTALVNQQAVGYREPTVGFINRAIYAIGTDAVTYAACFHDIIIGNNETFYSPFQFSAAFGYDLCTGWGTPTGSNLVNALAPQPESDLTRESDYLSDSNAHPGDTITLSTTITNQSCSGSGTSAGAFHVGFYWSTDSSFFGDSPFHEALLSGCAEGGSVSITQNVAIASTNPPGIYYVGYKIDDLDEVMECNTNDKGIFYAPITVSPSCSLTVSPKVVELPAKGGSKTVKVKVKARETDCDWTAVSNEPFITITEGASGIGNGTVHYTVPGNTNSTELTGTMTIAGQTVTVNQAAGGCTFSLSPKSANYSFIGIVVGHSTVKVKAKLSNCAWTAVSNDSFITIIGATSGVGNGTVSYTVAENPNNNAPRTGTITIGGETFTITEASVLP